MHIEHRIEIGRPLDEVWQFLSDVPAVVGCIPGAELSDDLGEGLYRGAFRLKVGPLTAKIEGEGLLRRDDAARSGTIEGKGIDRRGGSRVTASMSYRASEAPGVTIVAVATDLTLTGPLSQMGRTGLIEDVATRLTEEFAKALTERLTTAAAATALPEQTVLPGAAGRRDEGPDAPPASFDAGRAIRSGLWYRLREWFGRMFVRRMPN